MLEELGFPRPADRVYRMVLRRPRTTAELTRELGDDALGGALQCLLEASLVRFCDDAVVEAADPELALGALLAQREAEVHRHAQRLARVRAALAHVVKEYRRRQAGRTELEEIHGGAVVATWVKEQSRHRVLDGALRRGRRAGPVRPGRRQRDRGPRRRPAAGPLLLFRAELVARHRAV